MTNDTQKQLPKNLEDAVEKTETDELDDLAELEGKLRAETDAREEGQKRIASLERENKVLKDNAEIRTKAVSFSWWFLILIPTTCLTMLLISSIESFQVFSGGPHIDPHFQFRFELNDYAEAALIIAPIIFVATILGLIFKGVLKNHETDSDEIKSTLNKIIRVITERELN